MRLFSRNRDRRDDREPFTYDVLVTFLTFGFLPIYVRPYVRSRACSRAYMHMLPVWALDVRRPKVREADCLDGWR
jgi:hypothetical protein